MVGPCVQNIRHDFVGVISIPTAVSAIG